MSDIVIRGIEMWGNCDDCPISIDCELSEHIDGYRMLYTRPNKCPVIVLPAGHGDLIYKDRAMDAILGEPTDAHYPSWFAGIVNEELAVVPAENAHTAFTHYVEEEERGNKL